MSLQKKNKKCYYINVVTFFIYMGNYLFSFNIGKYEIGMYKHFKCWWFNNGYIKEFTWFYIFKND